MRGKWHLKRPSAALVVSMLALFVSLGGVGAIAGGALTTKKVKKISKQQTLSLAPGLSVASAKKADDANTVGGASLGSLVVGNASNGVGGCDLAHNDATFVNCGSLSLTLPRSGRVLLNMAGAWRDNFGTPPTSGTCRITVDGTPVTATETRYGQATETFDSAEHRASLVINFITGVLGAGPHTFRLECNDPAGTVSFADDEMTAVMIGTD